MLVLCWHGFKWQCNHSIVDQGYFITGLFRIMYKRIQETMRIVEIAPRDLHRTSYYCTSQARPNKLRLVLLESE